ncbi:MAG: ABC transporter permease, partial [Zoogloeaceae bacterium]|nr:ABC transporter permease [Zoogloeaceae bacterium]
MSFDPVFLWSDFFLWLLVVAGIAGGFRARKSVAFVAAWQKLRANRTAVCAMTVLAAFLLVGLLDSLHYRERLPDAPGQTKAVYGVEVRSALDALLSHLREGHEKTYSAPFAMRLYAMQSVETPTGTVRDYPRLTFGGADLPGESA